MCCNSSSSELLADGMYWASAFKEKSANALSLRYVIGFRSIQNTEDEYLWKFSVPRRGVGKTENEKTKKRNADKDAHHN